MYDEIEIEDMDWDASLSAYTYQCPCGDLFQITKAQLADGEDIAYCPSCTLVVRVIYDQKDFPKIDRPAGNTGGKVAGVAAA